MLTVSAQFLLTASGAAGIVATVVQMTKFILDGPTRSLSAANQNNVVRMYVYAVSLVIVTGYNFFAGATLGRASSLNDILTAGTVCGLAIAGYHLLEAAPRAISLAAMTSTLSPAPAAPDPPPPPPAAPPAA